MASRKTIVMGLANALEKKKNAWLVWPVQREPRGKRISFSSKYDNKSPRQSASLKFMDYDELSNSSEEDENDEDDEDEASKEWSMRKSPSLHSFFSLDNGQHPDYGQASESESHSEASETNILN